MSTDHQQDRLIGGGASSRASLGERRTLCISVSGRFGLDAHQAFRDAYQPFLMRARRCEIDLHDCEGIDSAGLAQLLILRDLIGLEQSQFLLKGCSADVCRLLGYANFDRLFTVIPR
ncbi:STAS domain-containing protein [Simiduia aestuariiviva]|uniref:Anti-anti-sigma factor n=1 Tax=Simiduia aestuariiviva TaxID=1510459 RepID=A0A839UKM1_9GAMM|nr:STAS domain-containing protein [Simiduia aestuariiviva]MBB3167129.1 anti-anti-sigma factor [Simiduia aestuariiviva]